MRCFQSVKVDWCVNSKSRNYKLIKVREKSCALTWYRFMRWNTNFKTYTANGQHCHFRLPRDNPRIWCLRVFYAFVWLLYDTKPSYINSLRDREGLIEFLHFLFKKSLYWLCNVRSPVFSFLPRVGIKDKLFRQAQILPLFNKTNENSFICVW